MATSKGDFIFENPDNVRKLSDGNLEFALNLYKAIADSEGNGKNTFFSPLSISAALSMVTVGARNNTATELKKALKLDAFDSDDQVHDTFSQLLATLMPTTDSSTPWPFTLLTANRIYIEETYKLEAAFLTTLAEKYYAEAVSSSFVKDGEKSRREINAWVEKVTRDKIKNLLGKGAINASTRAILLNAIYFKGTWQSQFPTEQSHDGHFFRKADDHTQVRMMYQYTRFPFAEVAQWNCKVLELPYSGARLSMLLILPNEIDGLATLEANLNAQTFKSLINSLSTTKVKVTLPKFKLELGSSLKPILRKLGINDAFEFKKADFTGLSAEGDLYVDDVIHKAFVDVNEEGTEAAAATAVLMMKRCINIEVIPEFTADHPFLFAIYDQLAHMVLFLGRLTDPPTSAAGGQNKDEL